MDANDAIRELATMKILADDDFLSKSEAIQYVIDHLKDRGMTLNEYQKLAERTMSFHRTDRQSLLDMESHALHGLAAEVGEIHSIYQKFYQGHKREIGDIFEEVGDLLWFIAELCTAYDMDLDDVAEANISKLRKRYPDGFDPERSLHRND